jgi:uncharacterized protein
MRYGLSDEIIHKISSVFEKFDRVHQVILYGSRAQGNFKNGSDIDLTLKGNEITVHDLSKIESDIDDLWLPYTIDLSIYDQLEHLELKDHIDRMGVCFYKRKTS